MSTALAVRASEPAKASPSLRRYAAGLVAGVARAIHPQAALDISDPVWQQVLMAGGFGGTP